MDTVVRIVISLGTAVVMLAAAVDAAGQQQTQQREQTQARTQERAGKREIIPGSELMTSKEREDYRRRYAAAKTEADKEKVRADHIKAMQERARLRGLELALPAAPKGGGK
jgi:ABC-type transport system involved in cytochrome bd biosynthesis fused ATPase/permease subunit